MRRRFGFLCHSALETQGAIHALGIGMSGIQPSSVPVRIPSFTIVSSLSYSLPEAGAKLISITCIDADGQVVTGPIEHSADFPTPAGATDGTFNVICNIQTVEIPDYGDYAWILAIGPSEIDRFPLAITKPA